MNRPMITGGGKVRKRYTIGTHKAVLIENPESLGPIKYKFVLMIFKSGNKEPVLIVTSEKNEMQAALLSMAKQSAPELVEDSNPNKYFLGVFYDGLHSNLGGSLDWSNIEKFELQAFLIAKEKLNFDDNDKVSTEKSSSIHPETIVIIAIVLLIIYMAIFSPQGISF